MSYRIWTAGIPKDPRRVSREHLDRELRGGLIRAASQLPRMPSNGWYELRRRREKWWSNLLLHTDELIDAGVDGKLIVTLPDIWEAYIRERLVERDMLAKPKNAA